MSGTQVEAVEIEFEEEPQDTGASGVAPDIGEDDVAALLDRHKKLLEAEKRRRQEAERRAADAERLATEAQGSVRGETEARFRAEEQALDSGLASAEAEAVALTARVGALQAEGDFPAAAAALRELAKIEARAERLRQDKLAIASARTAATTPAQQPTRTDQIDLSAYSVPQRRWITDHPEYLDDPKLRLRLAAAHNEMAADDVPVDSSEYFDRLNEVYEKHMGIAQNPPAAPVQRQAPEPAAPPRRPAPAPLPVQRTAQPGTRAAQPGTIRLTAEEREAADIAMGHIPEQDYMENGKLMRGRYFIYHERQKALKARGRI